MNQIRSQSYSLANHNHDYENPSFLAKEMHQSQKFIQDYLRQFYPEIDRNIILALDDGRSFHDVYQVLSPSEQFSLQRTWGRSKLNAFLDFSRTSSWQNLREFFKNNRERSSIAFLEGYFTSEKFVSVSTNEVSDRIQNSLKNFLEEALDPWAIASFMAGSYVFRRVKLNRLKTAANQTAGFWNRAWGLRVVSHSEAFFAEVATFSAMGLVPGLWRGEALNFQTAVSSLENNVVTLGLLKGSGVLGKSLFAKNLNPFVQASVGFSSGVVGLSLGHQLQAFFGLRPEESWSKSIYDATVLQTQLSLGSSLAMPLLGSQYKKHMDRLTFETQYYDKLSWQVPGLIPVFAGGPSLGHTVFSVRVPQLRDPRLNPASVPVYIDSSDLGPVSMYPHSSRYRTPRQWAEKIFALSQKPFQIAQNDAEVHESRSSEFHIGAASALLEGLKNKESRNFTLETIRLLEDMSKDLPEGESLLVRSYEVPGLDSPLRLVSLPSTFLPESWSKVFVGGLHDSYRKSKNRRVNLAVEVGSGTGWASIYMARLGMAKRVIGLDYNPHAVLVGQLNAELNGVASKVQFAQSDKLQALRKILAHGQKVDLIAGCLPQISKEGGITKRGFSDYYPSRGSYEDKFGLGLVADTVKESLDYLAPHGRLLFNLGGRPGFDRIRDLFEHRGFHPRVAFARLIQQDPGTDISGLARLEESYDLKYEFFDRDANHPISASEAVNLAKPRVHHYLYAIEAYPYSGQLLQNALAATSIKDHLGYTEDPGSENLSLRGRLAEVLSRSYGINLAQESLFLANYQDQLMDAIIHTSLNPNDRILLLGDSAYKLEASLYEFRVARRPHLGMAQNLQTLKAADEKLIVLPFSREFMGVKSRRLLEEALNSAVQKNQQVIFVMDHVNRNYEGSNALMALLAEHPEYAGHVSLVQDLAYVYGVNLPLAYAVIPHQVRYHAMERYADATYSRASTLIQALMDHFLSQLDSDVRPYSRTLGLVERSGFQQSDLSLKLSQSAAFTSSPHGEHGDPIKANFGESENPYYPKAALSLSDLEGKHESGLIGSPHLTEQAVVEYLAASRKIQVNSSELVLGAGVHPLIVDSLKALRVMFPEKPLDVIIPKPSYGMFFPSIDVLGAKAIEVKTRFRKDFKVQASDLVAIERDPSRIRVLLINVPGNPSGQYYTRDELLELVRVAAEKNIYILMDEIFGKTNFETAEPSLAQLVHKNFQYEKRLMTFGGVSKEAGVGGLRFGFAASRNQKWIDLMHQVQISPSDPIAQSLVRSFYLPQWRTITSEHASWLKTKRDAYIRLFNKYELPFLKPQGGYQIFVDLSPLYGGTIGDRVITAENIHHLIYEHAGVKINSEVWAKTPGFHRFCFSIQRSDELVGRLDTFFSQVKRPGLWRRGVNSLMRFLRSP